MSDIAELHAQAPGRTGRIVAAIKPGQLRAGTPCEGRDGHALLNHLVAGNLWAAGLGAGTTIQACREVIEPRVAAFRAAGARGAEQPVPPDPADQQRFLAMLGRKG